MDQSEEKAAQTAKPNEHAKQILLVEDDAALAEVYQIRLQAEGYIVKHAASGEEALSIAEHYHPDLVLLDIILPKLSGFEVLAALRAKPETAKVKVIVLTAFGEDADRDRAASLGANDFLVKSQVVIADVIERVNHLSNAA